MVYFIDVQLAVFIASCRHISSLLFE